MSQAASSGFLFCFLNKPRALRRWSFCPRLQADQHHDGRRLGSDLELLVLAAHERGQLFVDDLDDHLRRGQALQNVAATQRSVVFLTKSLTTL